MALLEGQATGRISFVSEQTSMWSCLNHAIHGWNDGIGISQTDLINFFTQMGYAPDTLYLEGITPPSVNIKDVYRQLPDRPDIVTRIERTIGSSDEPSTLTSDDRYRCVGHQRLPMVSSDSGGFTTGQRGGDIPRLVFTHARQQHQGWQTLQPHPIRADGRDPRMSLPAICRFEADSSLPRNTRYGQRCPLMTSGHAH